MLTDVITIQPVTDASGYLDEDLPCCGCKYNLRGSQIEQHCPECAIPIQRSWNSHLGLYRWTMGDFKMPARIFSMLAGVILPIVCFMMAFWEPVLGPAWQSGFFSEKVGLLIGGPALYPFFPLLAYAIISLTLLVLKPKPFSRYWVVRVGIYGGVVISLHFILLITIAMPGVRLIFPIAVFITALWQLYLFNRGKPKPRRPKRIRKASYPAGWKVAAVIFGTAIAIVALTLVSAIFVIIVVGAPGWAFLTYGLLSVRLLKSTFEPPAAPMRRLLPFSWLGAYLAAWPIAVVQAMEAYTRLSTKPPDCYVCSAAAHGHAWFVGAKTVLSQEGHRVRMNRQMVVLKMAELALKAIVPTLHQRLRITYDRIGPPLARRIRHPLMADLAYLSLKPIEWITLIFIRIYLLLRQHRPASAAARSHRRRGVWGI